jgi:hypothetical protein
VNLRIWKMEDKTYDEVMSKDEEMIERQEDYERRGE